MFLIVITAAVILVIVLSIRSCGNDSIVEYRFQKVGKGEVVRTVFVTGKISFSDIHTVDNETSSGIVETVKAGLNAHVRKGDILATIKSDDLQFSAKQTKESFIQSTIALEAARDLLDQKKKLLQSNVIGKKEVEEAQRNLDRVLSVHRSNQNLMDKLNKDIESCTVKAPYSGQVVEVMAIPGMNVAKGTDLFKIVTDMKKMNLELDVNETDIGNVTEGKKLDFSVSAFPDKKFTGKISSVSTTSTTQGNIIIYKAFASCDNSSLLLKSGMSATASVFVDRVSNVLKIPNEALSASPVFSIAESGKRFVWKKVPDNEKNNGMAKIEVKTGLSGNGFTQITEGNLKENDEVLTQVKKKTKGQSIPGL